MDQKNGIIIQRADRSETSQQPSGQIWSQVKPQTYPSNAMVKDPTYLS